MAEAAPGSEPAAAAASGAEVAVEPLTLDRAYQQALSTK